MTTESDVLDEGCGQAWAKEDHQGLARYVYAQEASRFLRIPTSPVEALGEANGRLTLVQELYRELAASGIRYAHELWNPDDRCQTIRPPVEVMRQPGHGTCLDLSLLFSGLCLSVGLLPVVVVTQRHALVLVSLDVGPDDYNARTRPKRSLFTDGPLTDAAALVELIGDRRYVAVETTGFAQVSGLSPSSLEGAGRVDGLLSFEASTQAGSARFDLADDPLRFALDIAATHGRGIGPQRIFLDRKVIAEEVMLQVTEHGLKADRATEDMSQPVDLGAPTAPPPRRSRGVVGRDREKSVLASGSAGELVGVYGERGAGKTELMRWLAYEPVGEFADGTVYMRCENSGPLDVLQEVFGFFYDQRCGIQLTPSTAARYLGTKRARVLLDDFNLSASDTETLQDALAESALVVAAAGPDALVSGTLVEMGPFAPNDAVDLFERDAGTLAEADRPDLLAAFEQHEVVPRAVVVFARAVRAATLSIADVIEALSELPAVPTAPSPSERRLAEIIETAHPAYMPRIRLSEMVEASQDQLDKDIARLIDGELVKLGSPRYRWAGPVRDIDPSVAIELVTATQNWLNAGPVPDEIVDDRALVLRAIELAKAESNWRDVAELTRLSEVSLALGNRWNSWEQVLQSMQEAAGHLNDDQAAALAHHQLGTRALGLGDHDTARTQLESAIKLREQLGDRAAAALSRHNLNLVPVVPVTDSNDLKPKIEHDGSEKLGWIRRHPLLVASIAALTAICIALAFWAIAASGSGSDPEATNDSANAAEATQPPSTPTNGPTPSPGSTVVPEAPAPAEPTSTPKPTSTPEPTLTPEPSPTSTPTPTPRPTCAEGYTEQPNQTCTWRTVAESFLAAVPCLGGYELAGNTCLRSAAWTPPQVPGLCSAVPNSLTCYVETTAVCVDGVPAGNLCLVQGTMNFSSASCPFVPDDQCYFDLVVASASECNFHPFDWGFIPPDICRRHNWDAGSPCQAGFNHAYNVPTLDPGWVCVMYPAPQCPGATFAGMCVICSPASEASQCFSELTTQRIAATCNGQASDLPENECLDLIEEPEMVLRCPDWMNQTPDAEGFCTDIVDLQ